MTTCMKYQLIAGMFLNYLCRNVLLTRLCGIEVTSSGGDHIEPSGHSRHFEVPV